MISNELDMTKVDITFDVSEDKKSIAIMNDGKKIGQIYLENKNVIQICGFTEVFDLWACGPFDAKKDARFLYDVKLLFDNSKLPGKFTEAAFGKCMRCYREPCCCENKKATPYSAKFEEFVTDRHEATCPFNVKRSQDVEDRIVK